MSNPVILSVGEARLLLEAKQKKAKKLLEVVQQLEGQIRRSDHIYNDEYFEREAERCQSMGNEKVQSSVASINHLEFRLSRCDNVIVSLTNALHSIVNPRFKRSRVVIVAKHPEPVADAETSEEVEKPCLEVVEVEKAVEAEKPIEAKNPCLDDDQEEETIVFDDLKAEEPIVEQNQPEEKVVVAKPEKPAKPVKKVIYMTPAEMNLVRSVTNGTFDGLTFQELMIDFPKMVLPDEKNSIKLLNHIFRVLKMIFPTMAERTSSHGCSSLPMFSFDELLFAIFGQTNQVKMVLSDLSESIRKVPNQKYSRSLWGLFKDLNNKMAFELNSKLVGHRLLKWSIYVKHDISTGRVYFNRANFMAMSVHPMSQNSYQIECAEPAVANTSVTSNQLVTAVSS